MTSNEAFLGYSVTLTNLSPDEGGGWLAEITELPGCYSDGETPEAALSSLRELLPFWLQVASEEKRPIPSPQTKASEQFSGKFTLRVPKSLHRHLALRAEAEGISLNQYILTLISYAEGSQLLAQEELSATRIAESAHSHMLLAKDS